jgi:hypothetical protein
MRKLILGWTAMGLRRDPDQLLSRSQETVAMPDRLLPDQQEIADLFVDGLLEAFRPGTSGAAQDAETYARPWGFQLGDIAAQVHLWHGRQDAHVPISVAHYTVEAIPNCDTRFCDEESHLTLPRIRIREMLGTLVFDPGSLP